MYKELLHVDVDASAVHVYILYIGHDGNPAGQPQK